MIDRQKAFDMLHDGLPRQGPGSDQTTMRAIGMLPELSERPRIIDIACGPGRHTVMLTKHFQCPVLAIDTHAGYLKMLRELAQTQGVDELIETLQLDMKDIHERNESYDLIWCEGAIYILGFEEGLKRWQPILNKNACIALTEISWLTADPAPAIAEYWRAGYPGIRTTEENINRAEGQGFILVNSFVLPASDWWDHYYHPLRKRANELKIEYAKDEAVMSVVDDMCEEIEMYERYGNQYGYVFYIFKKP